MKVEFLHGRADLRRWQVHAAVSIAAATGAAIRMTGVEAPPAPAGVDLLCTLERMIVARGAAFAIDRLDHAPPIGFDGDADLVVDLCGASPRPGRSTVIGAAVLGLPPFAGALAAVLDRRAPVLELTRRGSGVTVLGRWAVAVENPTSVVRAGSEILGRLAHMVAAAVGALIARPDRIPPLSEVAAVAAASPSAAAAPRLAGRWVESRIRSRLDRLVRAPVDWRVIWRRRDPATPLLAPHRDATPFARLPDDGRRFYADPFLFGLDGRNWLFLEEFPYATGRGVLSVAEIDDAGRIETPRPFLEQDVHLSYPQVFAHDGEIWMVPETGGRRTVELWRAARFPDRWERHAVLLSDVELSDATPIRRPDGWWMFATGRERWCSTWDALHVFHAPALAGPWRAISEAPVVVDVATARPAGRMIDGPHGLLRPVQDSTGGYGAGLALTRVDRLSTDGFAETRLARFATPAPLRGLHTWNRLEDPAGALEVMDVLAAAVDFGAARRLDLAPVATDPAASAIFET